MWRKIQQKIWRNSNGRWLPIYNFGSVQNMEQESSVASTNLISFSLPSYEVISATFILIFKTQWEQRLQLSCPLKVFHVPNFAQTYISHMKKSNHILWFRNLHGKCRCQIKIEILSFPFSSMHLVLYGYNCSTNSVNIINVEI